MNWYAHKSSSLVSDDTSKQIYHSVVINEWLRGNGNLGLNSTSSTGGVRVIISYCNDDIYFTMIVFENDLELGFTRQLPKFGLHGNKHEFAK